MNELSLFTGAGGGIWGSKLLGWRTVGYVEQDDYCQKILRQRIRDGIFDDAPIFDDVRTFSGEPYRGRVDIITAGFPCQPFSVAGKQLKEKDDRNLWPDTVRIIGEVRPSFALLENVPALLSSGYFGTILSDLASIGYDAEWSVFSAEEEGAPHLRKRLWIIAYSSGAKLRVQQQWNKETPGLKTIPRNNGEKKHLADSNSHGESQSQRIFQKCRKRTGNGGDVLADSDQQHGDNVRHGTSEILGQLGKSPELSRIRWWELEPNVGRVANGVANRSNRLKALGNGQVPAVVRTAWRFLNGR